ncbi:MAG: phage/plasmid primase, P4 family [Nanoarchaeota archaeon]
MKNLYDFRDCGTEHCTKGDLDGTGDQMIAERSDYRNGCHISIEELTSISCIEQSENSENKTFSVPSMPDFEVINSCKKGKKSNQFNALYEGRWESLGIYRSLNEAHLEICKMFARYTSDREQINRLVVGSGLYSEEWELEKYRKQIIKEAIQMIPEDPQKRYFCERGSFIAKSLAEDIMEEKHYITLADTKEIYLYDNGVYKPCGSNLIEQSSQAKLQEYSKRSYINEVKFYVENETMIERSSLNNDRNIINLKNGLYDLKKDMFIPHTHEIISTVQIPVEYKPDAKCPNIDKFISEVVSEEDAKILVEYAGYALIKDYSIQKAFMLLGSGGNGKSVYLNLLQEFIGPNNCAGESLQALEENAFSTANLYGKMLNVCPDLPRTSLQKSSAFKQLTGNEKQIRAELKYKRAFNFANYARLVFSANHLPKTSDRDDAYFRRWVIVEFPNKFEGKNADIDLIDKLTTSEELSGLLNRALPALKKVLEEGCFSYNKTTEEIASLYRIKSESAATFASECIRRSDENTPKPAMYVAYTSWCQKKNIKPLPEREFVKELNNLDYQIVKEGSIREGSTTREYV